jgi:hypothetical protein
MLSQSEFDVGEVVLVYDGNCSPFAECGLTCLTMAKPMPIITRRNGGSYVVNRNGHNNSDNQDGMDKISVTTAQCRRQFQPQPAMADFPMSEQQG